MVTSLCVHHLPDDRKQGLFSGVFDHLVPGGWYLNYDPVLAEGPVVDVQARTASPDGQMAALVSGN